MKNTILFFVVISLFLLCGCTGYREIDRGYLASAIGITEENGKTNIYIEATSSSDVSDKQSERVVLIGTGDDIQLAYKNLNLSLVKPIYFEQLGTAIFDANSSDNAQGEYLEFLKNFPRLNLGIYIINTSDVKKLFEFESPNGVLGYDIMGLIKMYEKEKGVKVLNRFYQLERNKKPLPEVNVDEDKLILNYLGE